MLLLVGVTAPIGNEALSLSRDSWVVSVVGSLAGCIGDYGLCHGLLDGGCQRGLVDRAA